MDLHDVLALGQFPRIEYDVPLEWGQGTQFPGGVGVGGLVPWAAAHPVLDPVDRAGLPPCVPGDVDHVRLGEVQPMALEGRVDGPRLPGVPEENRQLDRGQGVNHPISELPVPVGIDVRGAGLPPQLRGVLEDLLDLEGREVGVRLHDQGDDAADRGGRVRSAAPPSCVCVLRGVTAEEVVARATGDAGLGLDYVGPGGADLRDQLVEGVAVPVVLARPPGRVACDLVVGPVDCVLVIGGSDRDRKGGRAHAREPVVVLPGVACGVRHHDA